MGEFSKEQEAFIKGQQGGADAAVAPWVGHHNEEKVKEEILGLSTVRIVQTHDLLSREIFPF